jgi:hypothetical protein
MEINGARCLSLSQLKEPDLLVRYFYWPFRTPSRRLVKPLDVQLVWLIELGKRQVKEKGRAIKLKMPVNLISKYIMYLLSAGSC